MNDVFDKLKSSIEKNVKGAHVSVLADSDIAANRFWVKTPSYDLNRILSGSLYKGIQSRNLVAIVGPEHTMKSSFMVLCMVEAQRQGYNPVIIDTEGGVTKEFCERWGLDTSKILYTYTPWVHEVKAILAQVKDTGDEGFVIGVDSVGGLDRLKSFEDSKGGELKADQGLLQKEIRGLLKLFLNICIGQNSIGIACGHLYGKPSSIPMPDQIGGGKAMKLFPSIIINLKKTPIKEGEKVIGNEIEAITLKNRVYPPFQKAKIAIDYTEGIRPCAGLIDIGKEAGLIEQKGAWYSYKEEKLGQGQLNAETAIEDYDSLLEDIDKWLEKTGYSTIDKEIEKAEEIIQQEIEKTEEKPKVKINGKKKK